MNKMKVRHGDSILALYIARERSLCLEFAYNTGHSSTIWLTANHIDRFMVLLQKERAKFPAKRGKK